MDKAWGGVEIGRVKWWGRSSLLRDDVQTLLHCVILVVPLSAVVLLSHCRRIASTSVDPLHALSRTAGFDSTIPVIAIIILSHH